jgi:hypothetical protein
VYTRDEALAAELVGMGPQLAGRAAYLGIHRIDGRGPHPWGTSRRT